MMENVDTTATNPVTAVKEEAGHKPAEIGVEVVVVEPTVILYITVGHTECVPIRVNIAGTHHMDTKRTRSAVTRCLAEIVTASDRLGLYLLINLLYMKLKI